IDYLPLYQAVTDILARVLKSVFDFVVVFLIQSLDFGVYNECIQIVPRMGELLPDSARVHHITEIFRSDAGIDITEEIRCINIEVLLFECAICRSYKLQGKLIANLENRFYGPEIRFVTIFFLPFIIHLKCDRFINSPEVRLSTQRLIVVSILRKVPEETPLPACRCIVSDI